MKQPTLKMRTALYDYVLHPMDSIKSISERNQVKYDALRKAIKANREWIDEKSMEVWREKKTMAMRMAEHLAERGNWRAIEFLLRANDINPEQRVQNTDQEIHITLEKNESENR